MRTEKLPVKGHPAGKWQLGLQLEHIWTPNPPSWRSHWAAWRKTLHGPQMDPLFLRQLFLGLVPD